MKMETTASMIRATKAAKISILRNGVRENLNFGTMKRVAEASALLQIEAPSSTSLRLTRGRKVLAEIPVESVNEASSLWSAYRDARGFGMSTAPRAEIVVNGTVRGYVAYNGKVFEGTERNWKPGAVAIFDPYASAEVAQ